VKMPARDELWPIALIFGGDVGGREGSLVVGLNCQGELVGCTKLEWSCGVLFMNSNFANLV